MNIDYKCLRYSVLSLSWSSLARSSVSPPLSLCLQQSLGKWSTTHGRSRSIWSLLYPNIWDWARCILRCWPMSLWVFSLSSLKGHGGSWWHEKGKRFMYLHEWQEKLGKWQAILTPVLERLWSKSSLKTAQMHSDTCRTRGWLETASTGKKKKSHLTYLTAFYDERTRKEQ